MSESVIVRLPNWLGDTVMAVPALRALRGAFPGARLVLAGPWAALLAEQAVADAVVTYPRAWRGRLAAGRRVRAAAGRATALLLPNSFEAAVAAWSWGARRRIGFADGGRMFLLTDAVPMPSPRLHQIDEYLLLAERAGARPVTAIPRLAPPAPDAEGRARVGGLLEEAGVAGRRPVVGIHLGAAFGPAKLWPVDRVAELCGLLDADGIVPLLLGTADAGALAEGVLSRAHAATLVGRDTPGLLPALLTEVDVVVCGDTGVGHLAAALGTPVVALFGPTDPSLSAPRGEAIVLTHAVACAPCFYRTCPIEHPCLRGISADEVRAAVRTLLAAPGRA